MDHQRHRPEARRERGLPEDGDDKPAASVHGRVVKSGPSVADFSVASVSKNTILNTESVVNIVFFEMLGNLGSL